MGGSGSHSGEARKRPEASRWDLCKEGDHRAEEGKEGRGRPRAVIGRSESHGC